MNGLVMYDKETGSLWSQIIGKAVDGPFSGTNLTPLAALQTTWGEWVAEHPDTLVLDKGGGFQFDNYTSYYSGPSTGIHGESTEDNRLDQKDLVVGVTFGDEHKAFPFAELEQTPVVNDDLAGNPLLITYDSSSKTGVVFDPVVDGTRLNFRQVVGSEEFLISDGETGSVWDPITGVALEGPLTGSTLTQIPAHYEFWFSWKDFRPQTELYQAG